jgi:hypothetical protein
LSVSEEGHKNIFHQICRVITSFHILFNNFRQKLFLSFFIDDLRTLRYFCLNICSSFIFSSTLAIERLLSLCSLVQMFISMFNFHGFYFPPFIICKSKRVLVSAWYSWVVPLEISQVYSNLQQPSWNFQRLKVSLP